MAKQPETLLKERILERLKVYRGQIYVLKTQQKALRGVPDLLMCVNGRFHAWELKNTAKDKVTPLQQHVLDKIQLAGGTSKVVHNGNWQEAIADLTWKL